MMNCHITDAIESVLGAWRRDERGAALTEFVVTLPIFVLLFSGIVWMGQAYQQSVEVNIDATFKMWDRATTVQHFRAPTTIPNRSGFAGDLSLTLHPSTGNALGLARRVNAGAADPSDLPSAAVSALGATHGTHGESYGYMYPAAQSGILQVGPNEVFPQANEHIKNLHGDFAMTVVNDGPGSSNESPSTSNRAIKKLSPTFPSGLDQASNGFVQAAGANIRWGSVVGIEKKNNYSIGNLTSMDFHAAFDTSVPPFAPDGIGDVGPDGDDVATVAVSRGMAALSRLHCFPAEIPGVQSGTKYANCGGP